MTGSLNSLIILSVSKYTPMCNISFLYSLELGHAVAQLVEALRYKPEGRGFNC